MPVPNTFANATTSIPLSQLDANFATAITLGNTAIQLGNTVTTLNNMSLANVTVSTGNVSFTQGTIGGNVVINTTGTANTGNLAVTGTLTTTDNITVNKTSASGVIRTQYNSTVLGSFAASSANYVGIGSESAHDVLLLRNSAEIARLASTGLTVTGTLSSTGTASINGATNNYALNVKGSGTVGDSSVYIQLTTLDTGTTNADGGAIGMGVGTSPIMYLTNYENAAMAFSTNASEKMRLDSSGNLLVGTTGTSDFSASATGGWYVDNNNGIVFKNPNTAGQVNNAWSAHSTGNNGFTNFYTEASPTFRGSIDYNRSAGQVRYNTTSDGTLKNKLGPAPLSVSKNLVLSAPISEFAWKDDPEQRPQIGPIAQELHTVFPGAVSVGGTVERKVTDEGGNTTTVEEYKPWGVDKTAFTWHLVVCAQDLYAQVETLKAKVAALEAA